MSKPILHLNLKRKWFDMIRSGEKAVEYRKLSKYWNKFFWVDNRQKGYYPSARKCGIILGYADLNINDVLICFSNGYAKDRPQFYAELIDITIGKGKPEWGAVQGEQYFCLHLGKILEGNNHE